MNLVLEVVEDGTLLRYTFEDLMRYHAGSRTRPGFVTDEFITLSRTAGRTDAEEARFTVEKAEMAARLLAPPADEVYDVDSPA